MNGPAEWLILVVGVLSLAVGRWQRTRPWLVFVTHVPLLVLAAAAARYRMGFVADAIDDHGVRFAVGWSAHRAAEALTTPNVAAAVVGASWAAASPEWARTPPPLVNWVAAASLGTGAALLGGSGWWVLPVGAWLVSPWRPQDGPASRSATVWLAVAALGGAVAATAEVVSLYDPARGFVAAGLGLLVSVAGVAVATTRPLLELRWGAIPPVLGAGIVAAVALTLVRDGGPNPFVGGRELPDATGREIPYRVARGCLVEPGGAVVQLPDVRGRMDPCPETLGDLGRGRRAAVPLFAWPPSTPIESAWPAAGGDAALLAQWPGTGTSAWGVIRVEVTVAAPSDARTLENPVTMGPDGRLPRVVPGSRIDVVVPSDAASDVGAFLAACDRVRRTVGDGGRCVIGAGDPAAWRETR